MALKDVAIGFGSLPGGLSTWHCPKCEAESDVVDWKPLNQVINQRNVDCRQCPKCNYLAWSCGDTAMMAKQQEKAEMIKASKLAGLDDPKEKPAEEVAAEPEISVNHAEEQIAGAAEIDAENEESEDEAVDNDLVNEEGEGESEK